MQKMRPIDVLNNLKGYALWPQSYHLSESEAKVCIDALIEMTCRWYPIEAKLPEVNKEGESGYILLSFENFSLPSIGRYSIDEDGDGNFYEGDKDRTCLSYGLFVNAWMPLPKPFEPQERSDKK